MKIKSISAVTLFVSDMEISCKFYSRIPGFVLRFGGPSYKFTSFVIANKMYLNLELKPKKKDSDFGRVIFYCDDVDGLYNYLKNDVEFAKIATFETKSADAIWGERFFHVRDPDNYQLSFAVPITKKDEYPEEDFIKKRKIRYKDVYKKRYRQN